VDERSWALVRWQGKERKVDELAERWRNGIDWGCRKVPQFRS
jgi:hypothetical protein